jgi:scyllo-inositol 2-dehydrogenase (NAD+)
MSKVRLGVIGIGRMGQVYAHHVARRIQNAVLTAIADPQAEATRPFTAQLTDIQAYANYNDLLADPRIQGVIITTPTNTHHDIVIAAAQAGKAIFCEKPTALTLAETDDMIAAAQKAGVIFQVGFMRRFDRGYAEAKRQIESGLIGRPVTIRSIGRDPYATSLEYANPAVSGGLIIDMAIHDFDIIRWMMADEVERVYTEVASLVYPELLTVGDVDNAMIVLRFKGGGLGNVEASRTAIYGYDIQCEIVGSEGTLRVGYLQETPVLRLKRDGVSHDVVPHFQQRFGAAYTAQIEHFVECLINDRAPLVTGLDARAALQIALAATASQHQGRVITIDTVRAETS